MGPEERYKDLCTTLPLESEETYTDLCSAFDDLTCLLGNLVNHIHENQNLRNVDAELRAGPPPPLPNYYYLVSEAAKKQGSYWKRVVMCLRMMMMMKRRVLIRNYPKNWQK